MPARGVASDAWSELVSAVLDARADPATARFDEELAAAQQAGLPADVARALRYWQRASVRAALDHARTTLPTVVAALVQSVADSAVAVDEQDQAWRAATESVAGAARLQTVGQHEASTGAGLAAEQTAPATNAALAETSAAPARSAFGQDPVPAVVPLRATEPRRLLVAGLTPLTDTDPSGF
ncbi:MAG TPA: hypothetical protein VFS29_09975 [Motilibacteraceae bacterium]|nr:hypothetical protein [Motilibacteraceae bacterium]